MSFEINWSEVAQKFKFATQDKDGSVWVWDHRPHVDRERWMPNWSEYPNADCPSNYKNLTNSLNASLISKQDADDWNTFIVERHSNVVGHPHAALMAEYAKDALTSNEPWRDWEYSIDGALWSNLISNPGWKIKQKYRRKVKMISIEIPLDVLTRFTKEPHFVSSGDLTLFRQICKEALEKSQ